MFVYIMYTCVSVCVWIKKYKMPGEMADIWQKETTQIMFLQGRDCGFHQRNNNTGTEIEETMEERGCRGRWSAAYKEKQSHTVCRERGERTETQNKTRKSA